jgi:hypothetical protein
VRGFANKALLYRSGSGGGSKKPVFKRVELPIMAWLINSAAPQHRIVTQKKARVIKEAG